MPGDTRIKLKVGKGFTYVSLSAVGALNGEQAGDFLYKLSQLVNPAGRMFWVEENDPLGENLGSWIIKVGSEMEGRRDDQIRREHGWKQIWRFASS